MNVNKLLAQAIIVLYIFVVVACGNTHSHLSEVQNAIDSVKYEYAPDSRTAIFDINIRTNDNSIILKGETNLPNAKSVLIQTLESRKFVIKDSIEILPDKEPGNKIYALVNNSVSNLRSKPSHSAELVTQATLGTPLKIYKQHKHWYLVQTPDKYIAWVDDGGIHLMDSATMQSFRSSDKVIYLKLYGNAYDSANIPVTDLVAGSIMELTDSTQKYYHVKLPDGRTGLVKKDEAKLYNNWLNDPEPSGNDLVQTAFSLKGTPYLWGGTSTKAMDCSGFTKTIYSMNGYVLPRDASQQIHVGKTVDDSRQFDKLKKGDLLFFGQPETDDEKEKVVHVGLWIGNNRFIHSSGNVHISSVDPSDSYYDEYNLNRYLRSIRIIEETNSSGVLNLRENEMYKGFF